ncbi:hypothetical protein M0812_00827 [Anaeramoeba flamelloides]|uniref:Uncharacterized protein n=1 Tax=Anaeramoeba flamelloides TaxID=1746091 RepID=A0AAV8A3J0_9EUKA|nr:hypothetical protein M0812_00827 [Anaeramoeba flamelloides]
MKLLPFYFFFIVFCNYIFCESGDLILESISDENLNECEAGFSVFLPGYKHNPKEIQAELLHSYLCELLSINCKQPKPEPKTKIKKSPIFDKQSFESIKYNILITLNGVGYSDFEFNSNLTTLTSLIKDKKLFNVQCKKDESALSRLVSLLTGSKESKHKINHRSNIPNSQDSKGLKFVSNIFLDTYPDSNIVSISSDPAIGHLLVGNKKEKRTIKMEKEEKEEGKKEKKRRNIFLYEQETKEFTHSSMRNLTLESQIKLLATGAFGNVFERSSNAIKLAKNQEFVELRLKGLGFPLGFNLKDQGEKNFLLELVLLNSALSSTKETPLLPNSGKELWVLHFDSLSQLSRKSGSLQKALRVLNTIFPTLMNQMVQRTNGEVSFQFFLTGKEDFDQDKRVKIAQLCEQQIGKAIVTDLKTTQLLLPKIYLYQNMDYRLIWHVCKHSEAFLKKEGYQVICNGIKIDRRDVFLPPILRKWYLQELNDKKRHLNERISSSIKKDPDWKKYLFPLEIIFFIIVVILIRAICSLNLQNGNSSYNKIIENKKKND